MLKSHENPLEALVKDQNHMKTLFEALVKDRNHMKILF